MTRAEAIAFNSGLLTAATLAQAAAEALKARVVEKPTRYPFAIEALSAVAAEAVALMHPVAEVVR